MTGSTIRPTVGWSVVPTPVSSDSIYLQNGKDFNMDPYEDWLGISTETGTADYFQLLGLSRDEYNHDTIKAAAQLQSRKLQKYQHGPDAEACEEILRRVKKARRVLCHDTMRNAYVRQLDASKPLRTVPKSSPVIAPKPSVCATDHPSILLPLLIGGIAAVAISAIFMLVAGLYYLFSVHDRFEAMPPVASQKVELHSAAEATDKLTDQDNQQSPAAAPVALESGPTNSESNPPAISSDSPGHLTTADAATVVHSESDESHESYKSESSTASHPEKRDTDPFDFLRQRKTPEKNLPSTALPVPSSKTFVNASPANETPLPEPIIKPFNNPDASPVEAEAAYQRALQLIERRSSATDIISELEAALALAQDEPFQTRVYQQLVPFYENLDTIDKLVEAHRCLLNASHDPTTIKKSHDEFYKSVLSFLVKNRKIAIPRDYREGASFLTNWQWGMKFPDAEDRLIGQTFEQQLLAHPTHEPTLLVLVTYYDSIHVDKVKEKLVLLKLKDIYEARNQKLNEFMLSSLASAYLFSGEPEKGALIYAEQNQRGNASESTLSLEATAWIQANQKDKALAVLKKMEATIGSKEGFSLAYALTQLGDKYIAVDQPKLAISAYTRALKVDAPDVSTQNIQRKLAAAMLSVGDAGNAEVKELLDPLREIRQKAEAIEEKESTRPTPVATFLVDAAKLWMKAKEPEKALAAIDKAAAAVQRKTQDPDFANILEDIGEVYQQLEKHDRAAEHYLASIKLSTSDYSIETMQRKVVAMREKDASLKLPPDAEALLDPNFKFRVAARRYEAKKVYSDTDRVKNMVNAASQWQKAGDKQDVIRCGKLAETANKRTENQPNAFYTGDLYDELGDIYELVGINDSAITVYVKAIEFVRSDDEAERIHLKIETLCQNEKIPLPILPEQCQIRLDPLNRFRVEARRLETSARENPFAAVMNLVDATESWVTAKEFEQAKKAASKAIQLLKMQTKEESKSRYCVELAESYLKMNDPNAALELYRLALANENSEPQKVRIQQAIDAISIELPASDAPPQ